MPVVHICDADRKTILQEATMKVLGWGQKRIYCPEATADVETYYEALVAAAQEARTLFEKKRDVAKATFHKKYPDGKLPDEKDDEVPVDGA